MTIGDIRLFHVFAADAGEHFAVHRQLAIRALIGGGADVNETATERERQMASELARIVTFNFVDMSVVFAFPEKDELFSRNFPSL